MLRLHKVDFVHTNSCNGLVNRGWVLSWHYLGSTPLPRMCITTGAVDVLCCTSIDKGIVIIISLDYPMVQFPLCQKIRRFSWFNPYVTRHLHAWLHIHVYKLSRVYKWYNQIRMIMLSIIYKAEDIHQNISYTSDLGVYVK